jgi:hypothetical protein
MVLVRDKHPRRPLSVQFEAEMVGEGRARGLFLEGFQKRREQFPVRMNATCHPLLCGLKVKLSRVRTTRSQHAECISKAPVGFGLGHAAFMQTAFQAFAEVMNLGPAVDAFPK